MARPAPTTIRGGYGLGETTIVAVVAVVAARVSTPPAMAVASTAASVVVVFVFAPALPPATAVCNKPFYHGIGGILIPPKNGATR